MKKIYYALLCFIVANALHAQVGIGTTSPNSSAKIDIVSTTQGVLFPRMRVNQRNAIVNPAEGLIVYQTDGTKGLYYFDGSNWRSNTSGFIPDAKGNSSYFNVMVSTSAGSMEGFADGPGITAQFSHPFGVAVDQNGSVYVADTYNHKIRKIDTAGNVTTLAGSTLGFANGPGLTAQFNYPMGLAVDEIGHVYVADQGNNKIRMIDVTGTVTTLAGSTPGFADGVGLSARFSNPNGVAVDGSGNVYVADRNNEKIRKIDARGIVTTLAGSTQGFADGLGTAAQFNNPMALAVDGIGNVYVVDQGNHKIRKIDAAGNVITFAGSTQGFADGLGLSAKFNIPTGVAVDGNNNVYVSDLYNYRIRKIDAAGTVTTLAGSSFGFADGPGSSAKFYTPFGIAVNGSGNVYVSDQSNHKIRKIVF